MSKILPPNRIVGIATAVGITMITLVVAIPVSTSTAKAAYCTQTVVETRGKSVTSKDVARQRAWAAWQKKVTSLFGLTMSNPDVATLKSEDCNHASGCIVKARPCKYVP